MSDLGYVYALYNRLTQRFYKRSGTVNSSVWSTAQGARNAKGQIHYSDRANWEVVEYKTVPVMEDSLA